MDTPGSTALTGHSHDHALADDADIRYLRVALALIASFMIIEVSAAVVANSLALLADAGHLLVDVLALGASLWAANLAARPAIGRWTYGFKRAEILSAAVNGATLLVIAVLVVVGAIRHLVHPPNVAGGVVAMVALAGVAVNALTVLVLGKANRRSMNVEGSLQHILNDLYAFGATFVAGVVILITKFERADALASLIVVGLLLKAAWGLLKASGEVLLEAAPDNVNLDDIRSHLLGVTQVSGVHDLHAWTVTSGLPVLSAHVVIHDFCFSNGDAPRILDEIQSCLAGHFDVLHSTFQLEPESHRDHEDGIH